MDTPKVHVTSEESSDVTTTDDGYEVHTQTRKTTVTSTTISQHPHEVEPSYQGNELYTNSLKW